MVQKQLELLGFKLRVFAYVLAIEIQPTSTREKVNEFHTFREQLCENT